jgi:hypothetical protein
MKRAYAKSKPRSKDVRSMRMGTVPILVGAIDLVVYLFLIVGGIICTAILQNGYLWGYLLRLGIFLGSVYLSIVLFTVWLFHLEKRDIRITRWNKIKTVFFHPVYLLSYLIAVCRIPLIRNKWEVIKHTETGEVKQ